jgi:hypothetical protein
MWRGQAPEPTSNLRNISTTFLDLMRVKPVLDLLFIQQRGVTPELGVVTPSLPEATVAFDSRQTIVRLSNSGGLEVSSRVFTLQTEKTIASEQGSLRSGAEPHLPASDPGPRWPVADRLLSADAERSR